MLSIVTATVKMRKEISCEFAFALLDTTMHYVLGSSIYSIFVVFLSCLNTNRGERMDFCESLREYMQLLSLKNIELASSIAVDSTLVSKWRCGHKLPSDREMHLEKIAVYFCQISHQKNLTEQLEKKTQDILSYPRKDYRIELYVRDALHLCRQNSFHVNSLIKKRQVANKLLNEIYMLDCDPKTPESKKTNPTQLMHNNCQMLGEPPEIFILILTQLRKILAQDCPSGSIFFTYSEEDTRLDPNFRKISAVLFNLFSRLADHNWKIHVFLSINKKITPSHVIMADIADLLRIRNVSFYVCCAIYPQFCRTEYFLIPGILAIEYFAHIYPGKRGHAFVTYDDKTASTIFEAFQQGSERYEILSRLENERLRAFYKKNISPSGHHTHILNEFDAFVSRGMNIFLRAVETNATNRCHIDKFLSQTIICHHSILEYIRTHSNKKVVLSDAEYKKITQLFISRLEILINLLEQSNNFQIAILNKKKSMFHDINVTACRNQYVMFRAKEDYNLIKPQTETGLVIDDFSVVEAFTEYFNDTWHKISARRKTKRYALNHLQNYKALLLKTL